MEKTIADILEALRDGRPVDAAFLERLVRARNREMRDGTRRVAKRRLMPFYLQQRRAQSAMWERWAVTEEEDRAVVALLQAKPRRTASGVTTVSVLTKPWPCAGDCLYCPSDVAMPKSYLSDEPACQRARRCFFDPYLQVTSRLRVLEDMGHPVDKVELIVLGGTWSDYPPAYRRWFVSGLFEALNGFGTPEGERDERRRWQLYEAAAELRVSEGHRRLVDDLQRSVSEGTRTYNEARSVLSRAEEAAAPGAQEAEPADVARAQLANERAAHRCVGLSMETRPDAVDAALLTELRRLGCTKVQMGVQSLRPDVRAACGRDVGREQLRRAFSLLRLFGFKIHAHLMPNLPGADPASDRLDYERLVGDGRFAPDEVKLYPCVLVASSRLSRDFREGSWVPYSDDELVDLLADDVLATPPYVRISRMIRDISATDIVAGSTTTNLRQLVERRAAERARKTGVRIGEIRMRELGTKPIAEGGLSLERIGYAADAAQEEFLQWIDRDGRIAGFLRLSLPRPEAAGECGLSAPPAGAGRAMIREVHVYGRSAPLHATGANAQHRGLGGALVEEACRIARRRGYGAVAVISAVGTRDYYRSLGFRDEELYQVRDL